MKQTQRKKPSQRNLEHTTFKAGVRETADSSLNRFWCMLGLSTSRHSVSFPSFPKLS